MKAIKTLICLLPTLTAALPLAAAPITLAFEAEATFIAEHTPFAADIHVTEGDRIFGAFTFTPDFGNGEDFLTTIQADAIAWLIVDGKSFTTTPAGSGIRFDVGNNQQILDGPDGLFDTLQLGGAFDQLPLTGETGVTHAGWGMHLVGPARLVIDGPVSDTGLPLPSAVIPADVEIWNLLASTPQSPWGTQVTINLRDGHGGSLSISAAVIGFSPVPEPSTWVFVVPSLALLWVRCYRRLNSN